MLSLKFIRENPDAVRTMLEQRNTSAELDKLLDYDEKWRSLLSKIEVLQHRRNTASKLIGELKKAKKDASDLIAEMRSVSQKIKSMEADLSSLQEPLDQLGNS